MTTIIMTMDICFSYFWKFSYSWEVVYFLSMFGTSKQCWQVNFDF